MMGHRGNRGYECSIKMSKIFDFMNQAINCDKENSIREYKTLSGNYSHVSSTAYSCNYREGRIFTPAHSL